MKLQLHVNRMPPRQKGEQMHIYGMRLRGFSPGCQPMNGLKDRQDDKTGKYWDILLYNRKLTDAEVKAYELDYLGEKDGN